MTMEATLAGAALKIVLKKLTTLLEKEYKLLKGLKHEVQSLISELENMHAYLDKLPDLEQELDSQKMLWRNEVRELSYVVEDCLDKYMLRTERERRMGLIDRGLSLYSSTIARHKIAKEIQRLKARMVEAGERRKRFTIGDPGTTLSKVTIDRRLPDFAQSKGLVGIEEPKEAIIRWLLDDDERVKVVSIVGSGGLGKTTLAMEVYRTIREKFDCSASVSVTHKLDIKRLLSDVLSQVQPDEYVPSDAHEEQLARKLARFLEQKRYLIIIDDIWNVEAWEQVKCVFPINCQCSRIITTTRNKIVAESYLGSFGGHSYEMKPLNVADSRKLFLNRIFGSEHNCPQALEEAFIEILKRCGGLPLAITTMSSLLSTKSTTAEMLNMMREYLSSGAATNSHIQRMKRILFLSYSDLPSHLKLCFLYLSTFPEDSEINKRYLVWRWIAEGFISTETEKSLQDIGEDYFNELINRSLIMPAEIQCDGTVEACRVHDVVLELLISQSKQENFVSVLNGNNFHASSKSSSSRWLSIQSKKALLMKPDVFKFSPHLRSLTIFGSVKEMPQLKDLHVLRVLDIEHAECLENSHVEHIGTFVQLKYLRIGNANISELPKQIGDLLYLEILDLRRNKIRSLPASVVRLEKLVCLLVDVMVSLPDGIGNMKSLEVLSDLNVCQNSLTFVEELGNLAKLRELQIYWSPYDIAGEMEDFKKVLMKSLQKLGTQNLKSLCINGDDSRKELVEACCSLPVLQKLEDLSKLGKIPTLTFLKINMQNTPGIMLRIGGKVGFQKLKEFIFCCSSGKGVEFFPGAMPMLHKLHLEIGEWDKTHRYGNFSLGLEHLPCLQHADVVINCLNADADDVMAFEKFMKDATSTAPRHPTLQITRWKEHHMVKPNFVLLPGAPAMLVDGLCRLIKSQYWGNKIDRKGYIRQEGAKAGRSMKPRSFEHLLDAHAEILDEGFVVKRMWHEKIYKFELENGSVLAIRMIKDRWKELFQDRSRREKNLREVSAIQHEHIVPVVGYYLSLDYKVFMLLYDYVGIGSLYTIIHGKQFSDQVRLDWERRSAIALSVAQAVSHIHSTDDATFHGYINSSSIVISDNFEARISCHSQTWLCRQSLEGQPYDVLCFGVLLLELLTSHIIKTYPLLMQYLGQVTSVTWDQWETFFDQNLLVNSTVALEMVQFMKLAIDCCAKHSKLRLSMPGVVQRIEEIQRSRRSLCCWRNSWQTRTVGFRIRPRSPKFRFRIRRFRVRQLAIVPTRWRRLKVGFSRDLESHPSTHGGTWGEQDYLES
uniref:Protein kinase domain-containing protein n=1 Tax=Oryza punctata TaxID=4537 RepID=A0A0E0M6I5_ORYPU